ncbi:hypothetical protein PybrP1_003012 [[Pythium] brassicae (nom. inval.)]|nr:hypothetical protein PybrP1_003012 [[Pythium] brassicae (nom. inval.)]
MAASARRRRVLALAEQGEWDDVLALVAADPALAQAQDDFGMLPLHWACTEPCVPLDVLRALLVAFPGACELENLSGMAPLHVAIASKLTGLAISALLKTRPAVAFMKDGAGRYPVELAMDSNLPKFTIDLIRKAGAQAVRSSSAAALRARSASAANLEPSSDDEDASRAELLKARSVGSLMASRQASEYARLLDASPVPVGAVAAGGAAIGPIESTEIALHLKELLAQLQQLSVDIRSSSSASGSTYRSSFSGSSSSSQRSSRSAASSPTATTVLWNPGDKLGLDLEPVTRDTGARIKKVAASRSSVLGVESLGVGDVLVSINGTSVLASSFASITRFLKHAKAACKLRFSKCSSGGGVLPMPRHARCDSSDSVYSTRGFTPMSHLGRSSSGKDESTTNQLQLPETAQPDTAMLYAKVAELLDTTLKKVSAVEETVRLSSAMAFCT